MNRRVNFNEPNNDNKSKIVPNNLVTKNTEEKNKNTCRSPLTAARP